MFKKLLLCCLLVGTSSWAHAQSAGLLDCGGTHVKGQNGIDLSYIHMGAADAGFGPADPGKVKLLPLVVHASLVNFDAMLQLALSGAVSNQCILGVNLPNGTLVLFQLSNLLVKRVTANANASSTDYGPYAYTQVVFSYSGSTLVGGQGGTDDGGLGPTGGWDVGVNPPS